MRKIADFCSLPDCENKYDSIGYCAVHAQRFRRYGDTSVVKKVRLNDGRWKTSEYIVWINMLQRCENPNIPQWKDYGGRGIKVCDRWHDFLLFLEDVGKKPSPKYSIDRIDNDGNYEPGNVRWATREEQARNRREIISTNTSGVSGVSKNGKNYMARVLTDNGRKYLGTYPTILEASNAITVFYEKQGAR